MTSKGYGDVPYPFLLFVIRLDRKTQALLWVGKGKPKTIY